MIRLPFLLAAIAGSSAFFTLSAQYIPPEKPGADGAIAVTFSLRDPDVKINQVPAPRLKLDPDQKVLLDRQPPLPLPGKPFDPETAHSLDTAFPVRFAVAVAADAPKGSHSVQATVTFFFCSKREGWCRRGTESIEVAVKTP